ncbi:MAG: FAD-binding protein, partial [Thermoplasmata archaeon]|nr:FAD-binding protein [Thermoplasmata archaeon]
MPETEAGFDETVDVLVVGSGAGGFAAALTAKALGLETVLVEKADVFGGTTAYSSGGIWVPNARVLKAAGQISDPDAMLAYLQRIAGDHVSPKRHERYLEAGPEMLDFLAERFPSLNDAWFWGKGYPDYHPEDGGSALGNGLFPKPIDVRKLGSEGSNLRRTYINRAGIPRGAWMTAMDFHSLLAMRWNLQ